MKTQKHTELKFALVEVKGFIDSLMANEQIFASSEMWDELQDIQNYLEDAITKAESNE